MEQLNFQGVNIIVNIIKLIFLITATFYTMMKITNEKKFSRLKLCCALIAILLTSIVLGISQNNLGFLSSNVALIILLTMIYKIISKESLGYTILITIISLCINYVVFLIAIILDFIVNVISIIKNDYINLVLIEIFHVTLIYNFFKIKKFKYGISFFSNKLKNGYFEILVSNISIILLFLFVMIKNYDIMLKRSLFIWILAFAVIMFFTIQKSLQLYYKQKLLIQDLKETKEELEIKKEEVKQLEQENLNFSKISHSIAHKQKALEHKLNELILKNEIANEIDIKDRIKNVTKDLQKETVIELKKTGIEQIDDMLSYMQAECSKSKIDFQLQLIGNIHQMINHHISKDDLEILLADHIKDAIIAINHANNINKSILVRIGKIDGDYGVYIYDSGIEFEIETFFNLGKKPSTTHQNDGGTGMGFMNTFDTLRKTKGSMEIYEYNKPCKDNFTKLIKFKFDDKTEFRIYSYRHEEIQKKNTRKELSINPLPL